MARQRQFDEEVVVTRAMEAFWTHGYGTTTPAMLAGAMGIGTSSLYNTFKNKRALFIQCLEKYQHHTAEIISPFLAAETTTKECLRGAFRAVVDEDLARPQRRGCLVGNSIAELAGSDPELAEQLRRIQVATTHAIADRIRAGQAAGDVPRGKDPLALAEHLSTTLAGLRVMSVIHDAPTLHGVIDSVVSILD